MIRGDFVQAVDRGFAALRMRVYKKIVSDLLREDRYSTIADLLEAAKRRCVRLRIPYDGLTDAINGMGDQIARELVPTSSRHVERQPEGHPLTLAEVAATDPDLAARIRATVRGMPNVKRITVHERDKREALRINAQAQLDTIERCEQLEREKP